MSNKTKIPEDAIDRVRFYAKKVQDAQTAADLYNRRAAEAHRMQWAVIEEVLPELDLATYDYRFSFVDGSVERMVKIPEFGPQPSGEYLRAMVAFDKRLKKMEMAVEAETSDYSGEPDDLDTP